jgi:hypothetical protein
VNVNQQDVRHLNNYRKNLINHQNPNQTNILTLTNSLNNPHSLTNKIEEITMTKFKNILTTGYKFSPTENRFTKGISVSVGKKRKDFFLIILRLKIKIKILLLVQKP